MKKFLKALFIVALVFGLGAFSLVSVGNAAMSTFDSGLDGWISNTPALINWASSGGNPDGYVRFRDEIGALTYISAPAKFLGDWSALDGAGAIKFDHRIFDMGGGLQEFLPYRIDIFGSGGAAAYWEGANPIGANIWETVVAPLNASDWTISSGSWSDLLSDVTELHIQIEQVDNTNSKASKVEIAGIDNVNLVPIPGAMWLLGSGLIGLLVIRRKQRK
jgi:hypothetical protein